MASWRLARGLEVLRQQINEKWPARSKVSDGTKGDPAHAARKSDHNPDAGGVVRALDITHDPKNGLDARKVAEALAASRDPRISYIISNGEICSGAKGPAPWTWRPYDGKNAHRQHFHISVNSHGDDELKWALDGVAAPDQNTVVAKEEPILLRGDSGTWVSKLQTSIAVSVVDGRFGAQTEAALRQWQKEHDLVDDGIAGPATWEAIEKEQGNAKA
jgi:peptidoglycan hydrolase-like protein with peptidoglycan-binding domain